MTLRRRAILAIYVSVVLERFGFYAVLTILALYFRDVDQGLGWSVDRANSVYATFLTVFYLFPIVGGFLADRITSHPKAVMIGAILLTSGELLLSVPDPYFVHASLALLVLGNALFKPSIMVEAGKRGAPFSSVIDVVFIFFLFCVNVGAFVAPLFAEAVRTAFSFTAVCVGAGFATASAAFLMSRIPPVEFANGVPDLSPFGSAGGCFPAAVRFIAFTTPTLGFLALSQLLSGMVSFSPHDLGETSPGLVTIALLMSTAILIAIALRLFGNRYFPSRWRSSLRLLVAMIGQTAGISLMCLSPVDSRAILIGWLIHTISATLLLPFAYSLLFQIAEPTWRALAFGTWFTLVGCLWRLVIPRAAREDWPVSVLLLTLVSLALITFRVASQMTSSGRAVSEPISPAAADEHNS